VGVPGTGGLRSRPTVPSATPPQPSLHAPLHRAAASPVIRALRLLDSGVPRGGGGTRRLIFRPDDEKLGLCLHGWERGLAADPEFVAFVRATIPAECDPKARIHPYCRRGIEMRQSP